MSQCTISCELHDYLEIACMYGYQVKLTLKDDRIIEGKAVDVLTTAEKREYLIIDTGREQQKIESHQLSKMQVLTANAKFKEVLF
ncbi:MAG: Rho-binding antiterminator [Methylococcales bacterium]|nr:Rho-binding antiterminator [Methylococcales bacterium]MDP3331536.1 Rho-binding antiterminator [Methylococcaceae bacterium]MDP3839791.1 Rho-binding antiterminator [Methylococcales bacterium]